MDNGWAEVFLIYGRLERTLEGQIPIDLVFYDAEELWKVVCPWIDVFVCVYVRGGVIGRHS